MRFSKAIDELKLYITHLPRYISDYRNRKKVNKKRKEYTRVILETKDEVIKALPDVSECLDFIEKNNTITYFNSEFESGRDLFCTKVYTDEHNGMKYVIENSKKLYYPDSFSDRHISYCYQSILIEQDRRSPHLYLDDGEDLRNVILFDCGCAEGSLTFSHIDEIAHSYMFEGNNEWIAPLRATFEPWKDKVTVVNGFLGVEQGQISLCRFIQDLINNGEIDCLHDEVFIKMDVEGAEPDLLKDISSVLNRINHVRLAVCAYHRHGDEERIIGAIPPGFSYRVRDGYMLFYEYEDTLIFPYFRHGVIRIER